MSWKKDPIAAPVLNEVSNIASQAAGALGIINSSASVAQKAVALAATAFRNSTDPALTAFTQTIQATQNFMNDAFNTGVFQLTINQLDVPGPRKQDSNGIPLLYPREALLMAIESFDDLNDPNRPQFSNDATVSAFGFLATSATADGLLALMALLGSVFGIGEWDLIGKRMNGYINANQGRSIYPDWTSMRLNQIKQIADTQKATNQMLGMMTGNSLDANSAVRDAINAVISKTSESKNTLERAQDLLTVLSAATKATGIYTLNVAPGVGGNQRLKDEIYDCDLVISQTPYTIVGIYAGGGPSLSPINRIRQLVF